MAFNLTAILRLDAPQVANQLNKINKSFDQLAMGARRVGAGARDVGVGMRAAGIAGTAVAGGIIYATKEHMTFEKEMSSVIAKMADGVENYQALEITAKELGASTVFTAQQAAQGFQFLALAGYKAREAIGVLPTTLQAAAASNLDLASTTRIIVDGVGALTPVMKRYGDRAAQAKVLADMLTLAQARTNTTIEQLGEAITYGGGALANMKIPLSQIITMFGLLANSGLKASMAGTAAVNMFNKLSKPTKKSLEYLEAMGINFKMFTDPETGKLVNLDKLVGLIGANVSKFSSDLERGAAVSEIFGLRGQKAVFAFLNNIDKAPALFKEMENSIGETEKQYAIMTNNIWGMSKALLSAISGVNLEIGKMIAITGSLKPIGEAVTVPVLNFAKSLQLLNTSAEDLPNFRKGLGHEKFLEYIRLMGTGVGQFALGIKQGFILFKDEFKKVIDTVSRWIGISSKSLTSFKNLGTQVGRLIPWLAIIGPLFLATGLAVMTILPILGAVIGVMKIASGVFLMVKASIMVLYGSFKLIGIMTYMAIKGVVKLTASLVTLAAVKLLATTRAIGMVVVWTVAKVATLAWRASILLLRLSIFALIVAQSIWKTRTLLMVGIIIALSVSTKILIGVIATAKLLYAATSGVVGRVVGVLRTLFSVQTLVAAKQAIVNAGIFLYNLVTFKYITVSKLATAATWLWGASISFVQWAFKTLRVGTLLTIGVNLILMAGMKLAALAVTGFGLAMTFATGPIGLVILGITAIIAVVAAAIYYWDEITDALQSAWKWFKNLVKPIGDAYSKLEIWNTVLGAIRKTFNFFGMDVNIFKKSWESIIGVLKEVWAWMKDIANISFSKLLGVFKTDREIKTKTPEISHIIKDDIKREKEQGILSRTFDWVKSLFRGGVDHNINIDKGKSDVGILDIGNYIPGVNEDIMKKLMSPIKKEREQAEKDLLSQWKTAGGMGMQAEIGADAGASENDKLIRQLINSLGMGMGYEDQPITTKMFQMPSIDEILRGTKEKKIEPKPIINKEKYQYQPKPVPSTMGYHGRDFDMSKMKPPVLVPPPLQKTEDTTKGVQPSRDGTVIPPVSATTTQQGVEMKPIDYLTPKVTVNIPAPEVNLGDVNVNIKVNQNADGTYALVKKAMKHEQNKNGTQLRSNSVESYSQARHGAS